jgi:hypothetical protein
MEFWKRASPGQEVGLGLDKTGLCQRARNCEAKAEDSEGKK